MSGDTILADAIKGYPNRLAEAIDLCEDSVIVVLPKEGYEEMVARIKSLEDNQAILFGLIDRLRQASPSGGKKSDLRKRSLANALVSRKNVGMTYAEIGKFLELGSRNGSKNTREQNMTHFGKLLEASPDEFVVTSCRTRCGKMVRLTKTYYEHLLRGGSP